MPLADIFQGTRVKFHQAEIKQVDSGKHEIALDQGKLNYDYLSFSNSFRDPELNRDKTKKSLFEINCRIKNVKLRGENSNGYIVPISDIEEFLLSKNIKANLSEYVGQTTTVTGQYSGDTLFVGSVE